MLHIELEADFHPKRPPPLQQQGAHKESERRRFIKFEEVLGT